MKQHYHKHKNKNLTTPCLRMSLCRSVGAGALVRQWPHHVFDPSTILLSRVIRMTKLVLVSAATNAASERSFSAIRRAKWYLQSRMKQKRLYSIMMLHVHKDRTDMLNLVDIANDFVS